MTECQRIIKSGFIPESFLREEIRDGYTITAEMKKVWTIELDLLRYFIRLCEKHNLRYWVGFGTLLGAVRHKGFIPWDDDLDVWMPRSDYNKLIRIKKDAIEKPYFLQTTLNDNDYYSAFARLRNSNTTGVLISGNNKCNNGIYIDIYPLDGQLSNERKQRLRSKYIYMLNVTAHAFLYNVNPHIIAKTLNCILHFPFVHYDYKKVYKKVNTLAQSVKWSEAQRVGIVVFWPYPFDKTSYLKSDFEKTIQLPYENLKVNVPFGYNHILRTLYGDYMSFPPTNERGTWHHFTFDPDTPYYHGNNK